MVRAPRVASDLLHDIYLNNQRCLLCSKDSLGSPQDRHGLLCNKRCLLAAVRKLAVCVCEVAARRPAMCFCDIVSALQPDFNPVRLQRRAIRRVECDTKPFRAHESTDSQDYRC